MDKKNSTTKAEGQKSTSYLRHQRQKFWQIVVPVGVGVLLILAIAVMVVLAVSPERVGGSVSQWADASLIWLLLPVLAVALITTLVLFGLVFLVSQLLDILPRYTFPAQQYVAQFEAKVKIWSKKIVSPIFTIKSVNAGVGAFFSSLLSRLSK